MKTGSPATSLPLCALTLPSGQRLEPGRMFSRKQRTAEAGVRDRLVPPGGGGTACRQPSGTRSLLPPPLRLGLLPRSEEHLHAFIPSYCPTQRVGCRRWCTVRALECNKYSFLSKTFTKQASPPLPSLQIPVQSLPTRSLACMWGGTEEPGGRVCPEGGASQADHPLRVRRETRLPFPGHRSSERVGNCMWHRHSREAEEERRGIKDVLPAAFSFVPVL